MIFNKYKYWKNKYNEVWQAYNSLYRINIQEQRFSNILRDRIRLARNFIDTKRYSKNLKIIDYILDLSIDIAEIERLLQQMKGNNNE